MFEAVDTGTLVLDDVDQLSRDNQAKLLNFLDSGSYHRLGEAGATRHADVRVIITTNKNLLMLADSGEFLPDLLYRIRSWWIGLPSLSECSAGVPPLANHLLTYYDAAVGRSSRRFDETANQLFGLMSFPGNVRELNDVVRATSTYCDSVGFVSARNLVETLRDHVYGGLSTFGMTKATRRSRDGAVRRFLPLLNYNARLTAVVLECSHQTVYDAARRLGLLPRAEG